jgi:hypothetical protein
MSKGNKQRTPRDEGLRKQPPSDRNKNRKIEKSYHPTPPKPPKSDGGKKKS